MTAFLSRALLSILHRWPTLVNLFVTGHSGRFSFVLLLLHEESVF